MRRHALSHPDQLAIEWPDEEAIERMVEARVAERFEGEAIRWRFRLITVETVMMGSLILVAGLLLKQPTLLVVRAALMVAASCFATGLLLLGLSAGTGKLMTRFRTRRRS